MGERTRSLPSQIGNRERLGVRLLEQPQRERGEPDHDPEHPVLGADGLADRGDSGGPVFLGKTRTVVGIVSDGDPLCQETSVNDRTDTKSALRFVKRFVRQAKQDD